MSRQSLFLFALLQPFLCKSIVLIIPLFQAIHKAGSEAEKVKYQEQFMSMWNRRLPHSKRWDKAFGTLHAELEAMRQHLQAFYDQHK